MRNFKNFPRLYSGIPLKRVGKGKEGKAGREGKGIREGNGYTGGGEEDCWKGKEGRERKEREMRIIVISCSFQNLPAVIPQPPL
jgi:hypothetical protein